MTRCWLVLALVGCNQLYGLEETIGPTPPDSDKDGIADEADNCVLVANVDQVNGDGDTFGDACDPCPMGEQSGIDEDRDGVDDSCDICPLGPNHDEDGDGLVDGCDNCPGEPNHEEPDDQIDVDADGVGDACDPDPGAKNVRVFFESFAPSPDPQWNSEFIVWMGTGEGYAPIAAPPSTVKHGPWNRRGAVTGQTWQLTTLVDLPSQPPNDMRLALGSVEESDGMPAPQCEMYYDASDGMWHFFEGGQALSVTSPVRVTMQITKSGGTSIAHVCRFGKNEVPGQSLLFTATYFPMLVLRSGIAEFRYVDVVQ